MHLQNAHLKQISPKYNGFITGSSLIHPSNFIKKMVNIFLSNLADRQASNQKVKTLPPLAEVTS